MTISRETQITIAIIPDGRIEPNIAYQYMTLPEAEQFITTIKREITTIKREIIATDPREPSAADPA